MHMRVAVLFCLLMVIACRPPAANTNADRANTEACLAKLEAATLEIASKNRTLESLQNELDQLATENAELKLEVEHVELINIGGDSAELERARDEARRYKEGLERAVARLNEGRPGAMRTPPQRKPRVASSVFPRQPLAIANGTNVIVEGQIHNAGSEVAVGYLELTLHVDGKPARSTTLTLEIEPRTVADYDWTFTNSMTQGQTPEVTAEWGDYR